MENVSDEELVEHVKEGRVSLFEMLIHRHNERLRRVVRSVLKDDAQVDDVLQETFMRAFSHLADFQGASKFASWLTRIAVNEAVMRKRRAVDSVDVSGLDLKHRDAGPEDVAASKQLGELLEKAVEQLPEMYRDVFMLRVVDGYSVAETAWVVGCTEEAVRTRAFRANEQLRLILSDAAEANVAAAETALRSRRVSRSEPQGAAQT